MLAAASVAEPMAKPRQNARLCHNDDGRDATAAGASIAASMRDQASGGGATGATASASPPSRSSQNATSEASAGSLRQASLDLAAFLGAEHAQHVFGGNRGCRRRPGLWCRPRSSFETGSEFQQSAPDPALHRAERHAHARRQLLIGRAVEERRPDRGRMACFQLLQAAGQALVLLRQLDALDRAGAGSLTASAASIGSMRRLIALARSRSIARLRAIATIQVIGLARPGSKAAALRHTVT